jgi:preprotein translocase subunit YajC
MMFLLESTGTTVNTAGGGWTMLIMLGVMFVFLYFFMIRPQKKQEKEKQDMQNGLAVGDEVTTIGGIIGKVVSIKGETFVLETTRDKTHIRFLRGAIRSVDVKAADIAAQIIETKDAPAAAEAPATDAPKEEANTEENK